MLHRHVSEYREKGLDSSLGHVNRAPVSRRIQPASKPVANGQAASRQTRWLICIR
jgi:hypothetical protein